MDDQTRGRPRCSRLRLVTAEDLRSQLAEYEARFGVPSDRLADAFRRNGQLEETQEFLDWSALYSAMWPRQPVPSARKPRGDVLPRWVRSLDDHWSWLAEQLDYSGGRLEDDSVQVVVAPHVADAGTVLPARSA